MGHLRDLILQQLGKAVLFHLSYLSWLQRCFAILINNDNSFDKLRVFGRHISICLLADDTTIFFKG